MDKKIKIYTISTCQYCTNLKFFLKEKNIPFENLDVSQNKDALNEMREKTGQLGAPVIDIDGKIIIGFDKEKILQEIDI